MMTTNVSDCQYDIEVKDQGQIYNKISFTARNVNSSFILSAHNYRGNNLRHSMGVANT